MDTVSTWAQQADADLRAVEDEPAARLEFARSFFTKHPHEHLQEFGNSELAFMEWEVRRGCLNPLTDRQLRSGTVTYKPSCRRCCGRYRQ